MNLPAETKPVDPSRCPICGRPNQCRLCSTGAYKGPCWCASVKIPEALLACVPAEARNRACLCEACVQEFHRRVRRERLAAMQPGDCYFDAHGLMVFTEAHLRRRGYCCGNNCRHCPYPTAVPLETKEAVLT